MLVPAVGADGECKAGIGIVAGGETLPDLSDVGALIGRDCGFEAQIAPAIPWVAEDACCIQHVSENGRGRWDDRAVARKARIRCVMPDPGETRNL